LIAAIAADSLLIPTRSGLFDRHLADRSGEKASRSFGERRVIRLPSTNAGLDEEVVHRGGSTSVHGEGTGGFEVGAHREVSPGSSQEEARTGAGPVKSPRGYSRSTRLNPLGQDRSPLADHSPAHHCLPRPGSEFTV
jgi:hypothetical protein